MGKLTSYLLGLGIVLFSSYYYLTVYYKPLIQWMGPSFGTPLVIISGLLLFLLGDPLKETILIPIFILTGIAVGVGARKGRKAFISTASIYASILSVMGISLYFILFNETSALSSLLKLTTSTSVSGVTNSGLPPVPKGSSMTAILSEPLIERILSTISSFLGKGTSNPLSSSSGSFSTSTISTMVTTYGPILFRELLLQAIEDFLIVAIVAMLVGYLINRYAKKEKKDTGKTVEKEQVKENKDTVKMALILILTLLVVLSFSIPVMHSGNLNNDEKVAPQPSIDKAFAKGFATQVLNSDRNFYTDQNSTYSFAGGFIGKTGSMYNVYGTMQSNNSARNQLMATNSTLMSAYFVTYNISNLLTQLGVDNLFSTADLNSNQISQVFNLLPGGMVLFITSGSSNSGQSSTYSAASNFVSSVGGTSLKSVLALNVNLSSLKIPQIGVYLFSFIPDYKNIENKLVENNAAFYGNSQSSLILKSSIQDGNLSSVSENGPVDSFIMMGGSVHSSEVASDLSSFSGLSKLFNSKSDLSFSLSVFEQNHVYTSSGNKHSFTMAKLINYDRSLNFSGTTESLIVTGFPVEINNNNRYEFYSYTNNKTLASDVNFGNHANMDQTTGVINPDAVNYNTNANFPAKLKFSEKISNLTANNFAVSIGVTNKDTNVLKNLSINETAFTGEYGESIHIISGSSQSKIYQKVSPGKTIYLNFTVRARNPGFYTLGNPLVKYENNNTNENSTGPLVGISVASPPVQDAINNLLYFYVDMDAGTLIPQLKILLTPLVGYFYLFDLIVLLVILGDLYIEIRAFRRWRANKKKPVKGSGN